MSSASTLLCGVTEARGSYNRHAATQAAGGALALPLLEKAVQALTLESDERPIVIADYGSSQGRNSLAPMRTAIAAFRRRAHAHRPICVVHVDVVENDFSTLFDVLDTAPENYISDDPDVFPSAVGRSFYRPVLPPDHVHLGWSSYAAVWLSRAATRIPDHFWIPSSTGAVRAAFERQAGGRLGGVSEAAGAGAARGRSSGGDAPVAPRRRDIADPPGDEPRQRSGRGDGLRGRNHRGGARPNASPLLPPPQERNSRAIC
jgi:hypothetical protein